MGRFVLQPIMPQSPRKSPADQAHRPSRVNHSPKFCAETRLQPDEIGAKSISNVLSMGPDQFGEIGSEPWKTISMETYFPNARSRQQFLSGPKQRFKARRLRGTAAASTLSLTGFFGSGRAPLPPLSSLRLLPPGRTAVWRTRRATHGVSF